MDKTLFLKEVPAFKGISSKTAQALAAIAVESESRAGTVIFAQNSASDAVFIIIRGEVSITRELGEGRQKALAALSNGSLFGESAFFSEMPRTATAAAMTDCLLLKISKLDIECVFKKDPVSGMNIMSQLLRSAMQRLEETSKELATIYETGKLLSAARDMNSTADEVILEILHSLPASGCRLYLYNEFNFDFEQKSKTSAGMAIEAIDKLAVLASENPAGIILDNPSSEIAGSKFEINNAAAAIISPIFKNNKCLGFFIVWSETPLSFRTSHKLLLATVCGQLAEAVENLKHQQEERDKARLNSGKIDY